jgi:hypothetical protein
MKGITLQEMSDEAVQQLYVNYVRQPAYAHTEGTASAYTVTLDPAPTSLVDGFGITVVPHIANAANPTLNINGLGAIALKDQKGLAYAVGKLQVGKPYTFKYVGADFLADSSGGSGNAVAGDIRAGKTATTDNGDVVGTLPIRAGGTVIPSTTNQTKQAGVYDTDIVVQGSSNLIASNIKKDVSIFGVTGSVISSPSSNVEYITISGFSFSVPVLSSITIVFSDLQDITALYVDGFRQFDVATVCWVFGVGINGVGYRALARNAKLNNIQCTIEKIGLNTLKITNTSSYYTVFASNSSEGDIVMVCGIKSEG